jgi:hypothetical protein
MGAPGATVFAAALLRLSSAGGVPADDATPTGLWRTIDDRTGKPRAIIRTWTEQGRLRGRIEHVYPRPDESPDPVCRRCTGARRGQKVIGMIVLWGHRLERERWSGGRVLDPEMGKDYPGRLAFPADLEALARAARDAVEQYRPYVALIYVDVVEFEGQHIRRY